MHYTHPAAVLLFSRERVVMAHRHPADRPSLWDAGNIFQCTDLALKGIYWFQATTPSRPIYRHLPGICLRVRHQHLAESETFQYYLTPSSPPMPYTVAQHNSNPFEFLITVCPGHTMTSNDLLFDQVLWGIYDRQTVYDWQQHQCFMAQWAPPPVAMSRFQPRSVSRQAQARPKPTPGAKPPKYPAQLKARPASPLTKSRPTPVIRAA